MGKKKSRIEFIDLFRSFGIILMIMGHIKFGSHFSKWIHAFHMPMFFFVSGWFYRRTENVSVGQLILRKAKSLLRPYIIFELFQWLILKPFVFEYRNLQTLIYMFTEITYKIPIESGTFGISPIPGAMWFLVAIFLTETIYIVLDTGIKTDWKLHIAVLILVACGMLAPSLLSFRLPWALDASFVGTGFFHLARIIHGSKVEKIMNLKLWQSVALGAFFSALIMSSPVVNMRTGSYGWYLPFWFNSLGTITTLWNISRDVEYALKQFANTVGQWLKNIGKNSIVYLCFNQTVILGVTKIMSEFNISGFIGKILVLILTLVILSALEKLIVKTRLKVLIGR